MQTVTFYSYKGGSGRSLLLADAARYLALSGKRVVALDFDLEAPGLHYKLNVGAPGKRPADIVPERGVVDYILAANAGSEPERLEDYLLRVPLPPGGGALWLMPAGSAPSGNYWRSLTNIAELGMLRDPDGMLIADFLELKVRLEDDLDLDFLLIDARTGITELAGISTTLLADTVVCLMLDNPESLAGSRAVLRSFGRALRLDDQDPVEGVTVLSRVAGRDESAERRVHDYLTEPGTSSAETLSVDTLFVLPEEPDAGRAEPSLLDRGRESADSTLGRGFTAIMRRLDPALGPPTAALRRQQATDALRARLTSGTLRTTDGRSLRFRDDQLTGGEYLESGSAPGECRYADLSWFSADQWPPHFVAEYVDDLSAKAPIDWWLSRDADKLYELLLFTIDWEGRLRQRLLRPRSTPAGPYAKLEDPWIEEVELA